MSNAHKRPTHIRANGFSRNHAGARGLRISIEWVTRKPRPQKVGLVLVLVLLIAPLACANQVDVIGEASSSESSTSSTGGTSAHSGSHSASTASTASGGAIPPTQRFGSVLAIQNYQSSAATDAFAFYEATVGELGDCVSHPAFPSPGHCVLETCAVDAPVHPRPAAGVVTFSSGPLSLAAAPSPNGNYMTASLAGALWAPGAKVTIEAAGGDVPKFNEMLVGPAHLGLTSPPKGFIDRTSGLSVAWAKTEAPLVAISVQTHSGPVLVCRFDGSNGSAFVPPSALAAVPEGTATLWIASISETSVSGGDFETYIGLREEAFVGDVTVK